MPSRSPGQLAIGAGAVWLTDPFAGGVWRVDPGPDAPPPRIVAVDQGVDGIAAGADAVWTSNPQTGTVARIDPATGRVTARVALGGTPRGIALGAGRLWVAVAGGGTSVGRSLAPGTDVEAGRLARLRAGAGRTRRGPGSADRLRRAAGGLLGGRRSEAMNAAVAFVLREHGFRAGRFSLAMQPCNDALAQTGNPDEFKCRSNATRVCAQSRCGRRGRTGALCVLGDDAAGAEPGAGRARVDRLDAELVGRPRTAGAGWGLATSSTRPAGAAMRGSTPPTTTKRRRARCSRSGSAAGGVFYAKAPFDLLWGTYFRRAARRIGLPILGAATVEVDPRGGSVRNAGALVERIRASGARVVYLDGVREVVPSLRARLGSDVSLVYAGRSEPVATLFEAVGPPARGVYVTVAGMPRERLGPAGRSFVRDFGATRPGGQVPVLALYAAAATEAMLDAIARSDGTRESVSRALADVQLDHSPLGPIAFNRFGELERNPVAVVRAEHGGAPHDPGGTQGGTVVDVIEPDARLVGEPGSE